MVSAPATALGARLSSDVVREGMYGYGALLVGLCIGGFFEVSVASAALGAIGAVVSVPITAAARSALHGMFGLPPLALPFLAVAYLVLGAGGHVELSSAALSTGALAGLPAVIDQYLSSLGAILFLPTATAGLAVFCALLAYSRIAVVLSIVAFAASLLLPVSDPVAVGYNFVLTAIALGGVWFVPSAASFVLAGVGVTVCGLLAVGLMPYVQAPLLVLPFTVTVAVVLYAMRQRVADGTPKAVDFTIGTPEQNLGYYLSRLARFGGSHAARFRAPFSGTWTCTQGVDGAVTHRGPWRHAFDFEVEGRDGKTYRGDGEQLEDHHAYGLPILAPAPATVVKVVDGVPDNPVGQPNLDENWGNLVLLQHGVGLYSLLCHMAPGSIVVREGESVAVGQQIGACGNSGRSSVPHLHFHLQAVPRIGAPTIAGELNDVMELRLGGRRLRRALTPGRGDKVRNIEADPTMAQLFELEYGEAIVLRSAAGEEGLVADIDLYGNLVLVSQSTGARLYYDCRDGLFTVYDVVDPGASALRWFALALARVPLVGGELEWTEAIVPPRPTNLLARWLDDVIAPWRPGRRLELRYRRETDGNHTTIEGVSARRDRRGAPVLRTRAVLERGVGLVEIEVHHGNKTERAVRARTTTATDSQEDRSWKLATLPS